MKKLILLGLALCFPLFSHAYQEQSLQGTMEDHFHVIKPSQRNGRWVMLLPGTSGLQIFEDGTHYFNIGQKLADVGFTVLLVDYKPAYGISERKVKESTGEKILWVIGQAMEWALAQEHITKSMQGHFVGWSLAGEGLVLVANSPEKIETFNLRSMALYYPSNKDHVELDTSLPVLIMSGAEDKVTKAKDIETYWGNGSKVTIEWYENSHHGFDVESLKEGKSMRFPPVLGKKYLFKYNEQAAAKAEKTLISFLLEDQ